MMLGEEKSTVTVDLGDQQETLDERMATGRYASESEVVQEALQALEREDALIEELMEDKMQGAVDDLTSEAGSTPANPRVGP